MGEKTHINWTNKTWNPWMGCKKVSPGCKFCYMYRDMAHYGRDPMQIVRTSPATFNAPLKWKDPAKVFTCSWSDWFIEEADQWRPEAWDIVKRTPHLTYQILTKRPERIADHLPADWGQGYPNVWLGTSVESQEYAEKRIPLLLTAPARVRFLSCEPLLGPLNLFDPDNEISQAWAALNPGKVLLPWPWEMIDWVISGGESGPKARTASIEWFRSLRDQCHSTGVAYHHKQHGGSRKIDGEWGGRELDGVIWDQMPQTEVAAV